VPDRDRPRLNVTFYGYRGPTQGYLVWPSSGNGPGLVVIHDWWGLTEHVAGLVDRFAAAGFVALAPDLYGGATARDVAEADRLMSELLGPRAARDLASGVDYLLQQDDVLGEQVGAVGFGIGGARVLDLAVEEGGKVAAAVSFCPLGPTPEDYSQLQASVLAHFGEQDDLTPLGLADELRTKICAGTGRDPEIELYPGGHAFVDSDNLLGTYDPDLADTAWDRTVAFLHDHLG
jgi:carboxymethylenebutenolidase